MLAFPDLARFQLNTSPQYKTNCSAWMNGADFLVGRKLRGSPAVTEKTNVAALLKLNKEEFSLRLVITPINLTKAALAMEAPL